MEANVMFFTSLISLVLIFQYFLREDVDIDNSSKQLNTPNKKTVIITAIFVIMFLLGCFYE